MGGTDPHSPFLAEWEPRPGPAELSLQTAAWPLLKPGCTGEGTTFL